MTQGRGVAKAAPGGKAWGRSHQSSRQGPKASAAPDDITTAMLDVLKTESAGYLEAEGLEKTYRFTQDAIKEAVSIQSAKKRFDLKLAEGGQYGVDYTRDGRHLLLAGRRGHVAAFDWERGVLKCEMHLGETVRVARWLQNQAMFAVAQKKHVYIYDGDGVEVHRLHKQMEVDHMEYLPYHFLLASMSNEGTLRYQDMTMGTIMAEWQTKTGRCRAMRQNPATGIMHIGHAGGSVSLWSPSSSGPLVTMQCHRSPIKAIAIDSVGHHMVTSGSDGHVRVWDLRTYRRMYEYNPISPATSLDISQRGMLVAGHGPHVTVWRDALAGRAKEPYLHHLVGGETVTSVRFPSFDDVLGVGHSGGFSSILVPGAGEPNYDSFEANPFASKMQRREAEVKQILDKLPIETIMLDPASIGTVARSDTERQDVKNHMQALANGTTAAHKDGRRKPNGNKKRRMKSRENIISEPKPPRNDIVIVPSSAKEGASEPAPKTALDRFKMKSL